MQVVVIGGKPAASRSTLPTYAICIYTLSQNRFRERNKHSELSPTAARRHYSNTRHSQDTRIRLLFSKPEAAVKPEQHPALVM